MNPRFVVHQGALIPVDEVKFAYEVPADSNRIDANAPAGAHLYLEFKHGGSGRLAGISAKEFAALLNGDPF